MLIDFLYIFHPTELSPEPKTSREPAALSYFGTSRQACLILIRIFTHDSHGIACCCVNSLCFACLFLSALFFLFSLYVGVGCFSNCKLGPL